MGCKVSKQDNKEIQTLPVITEKNEIYNDYCYEEVQRTLVIRPKYFLPYD